MSRVINTDSPGKRRNQLMRTCAELMHRLTRKNEVDDDTRNMLAMLVFCLREIDAGVEESSIAWEKRDYWMKAEEFRQRWAWAGRYADKLAGLIFSEDWANLPDMLLKIMPYFSDIKVTKLTRSPSLWQDAHEKLLEEKPESQK